MNNIITWPTFGPQSITAILNELNAITDLNNRERYRLAEQLQRKFQEVKFKVSFDSITGEIKNIEYKPED